MTPISTYKTGYLNFEMTTISTYKIGRSTFVYSDMPAL